jgi:uncharacterized membrane protein
VIRRSPAEVWDYVADLRRTPAWRTTVTSIVAPEELRVGERFTGTTRLIGRTWHWELELTDLEVGQLLSYVVVRGIVKPSVFYRVEPHPEGARFTMGGELAHPGLVGRLLKPLALPALRRETAAHVANLKRILEAPLSS